MAQDLIGQSVGDYKIEARLGEGGMGAVFRARDVKLDRLVALKVLRPELRNAERLVARFEREARAVASLKHPGLVEVYRIGTDAALGIHWMALEFVPGTTLGHVIETEGRLAVGRALDLGTQLLEAVQAAHAQGIIHRDLKPANIMLTTVQGMERLKVLDFGLAKILGDDAQALTGKGSLLGTPSYMAPEQTAGETADTRTDIWAIGLILHEMLAGEPPFRGEHMAEIFVKIASEPPPALPASVPQAIGKVVHKALEKKREDRFQDVGAFLRELSQAGLAFRQEPTLAGEASVEGAVEPAREAGSDLKGQTLEGKYQILESIGSGGMGVVWKGRHTLLDRFVAVKVIHGTDAKKTEVRERFLREARAAASFVHPNAIPVRECGFTPQGLLYMVQDYSPGKPLRALLEAGPLPEGRALRLVRQCLLALGEAHRAGIVHRDVKPENILVEGSPPAEVAKLCDFGIARLQGSSDLTGTSALGTPHYMAPEQAAGEATDGRTDLYAAGCVLWEALTGKRPFEAELASQVLAKQITQVPDAPSRKLGRAGISPSVDALVLKALSKAKSERFQTAAEFIRAIDEALAKRPAKSSPSSPRVPTANDLKETEFQETATGERAPARPPSSVRPAARTSERRAAVTPPPGPPAVDPARPARASSGRIPVGGEAAASAASAAPAKTSSGRVPVPNVADPPARTSSGRVPVPSVADPPARTTSGRVTPIPQPVSPPANADDGRFRPPVVDDDARFRPPDDDARFRPPAPPAVVTSPPAPVLRVTGVPVLDELIARVRRQPRLIPGGLTGLVVAYLLLCMISAQPCIHCGTTSYGGTCPRSEGQFHDHKPGWGRCCYCGDWLTLGRCKASPNTQHKK